MKGMLLRDFYLTRKSFLNATLIIILTQITFFIDLLNGRGNIQNLMFTAMLLGIIFGNSGYTVLQDDFACGFDGYMNSMPFDIKKYLDSKLYMTVIQSAIVEGVLFLFASQFMNFGVNVAVLAAILISIPIFIGVLFLTLTLELRNNATIVSALFGVLVLSSVGTFISGVLDENFIQKITNFKFLCVILVLDFLIIVFYRKNGEKCLERRKK